MPSLLKTVINSIKEDFGHPASLYELLDAYPDLSGPLGEPARNIAHESVVRWDEWLRNDDEIRGWRYWVDTYNSFTTRREFANFGICKITEGWECDIQDVTGLANSKSRLQDFDTLDRMVETYAPHLIDPISAEKLRENLEWHGVRILREGKQSDFFARYLWDGRVFLINSDGSRHFAAARLIADRIGLPVPLRGKLRTYAINEMAVSSLQRDYEMFVISDATNANLGFHHAMKNFRASYLWKELPHQHKDSIAILLPRSDSRSMKVAAVMREAGTFDLGLYLRGLVERQYR